MITVICPNCNESPFIEILLQDAYGKIDINCNCGYHNVLSIEDYITLTKDKSSVNKSQCIIHNKQYSIYCLECKVHLCNQCVHSKNEHNTVNLSENEKEFDIEKIKAKINECDNYLNKKLSKLANKNKVIPFDKFNQLYGVYHNTIKSNNLIILLYRSIVNCYSPKNLNYIHQRNIIFNNKLYYHPYSIDFCNYNHIDSIIYYIKTFKVFHCLNFEGITNSFFFDSNPCIFYSSKGIILNDGRLLTNNRCGDTSILYVFNPNQLYKCEINSKRIKAQ